MDYNELCRMLDERLPGYGFWLQSATAEGERTPQGLAIRRGPSSRSPAPDWWTVVYFSVIEADSGAEDWQVSTGYTGYFDTLEEARREAKGLAGYLPAPGLADTGEGEDRLRRLVSQSLDELADELGDESGDGERD